MTTPKRGKALSGGKPAAASKTASPARPSSSRPAAAAAPAATSVTRHSAPTRKPADRNEAKQRRLENIARRSAAANERVIERAETERRELPLRVRAKVMLIYRHKRRRRGDVFTLVDAAHFNPKRHEWAHGRDESTTTGNQELASKADAKLGGHVVRGGKAEAPASTGADPIGD